MPDRRQPFDLFGGTGDDDGDGPDLLRLLMVAVTLVSATAAILAGLLWLARNGLG